MLDTVVVGTSLMVEGGASVISAFLSSHLVDLVIITIAPTLVGDGIGLLREGVRGSSLARGAGAHALSSRRSYLQNWSTSLRRRLGGT